MLKMALRHEMIGVNVDLRNNHPLGSLVKFFISFWNFGPRVFNSLIRKRHPLTVSAMQ